MLRTKALYWFFNHILLRIAYGLVGAPIASLMLFVSFYASAHSPKLTIAVSSNFYPAALALADAFHTSTGTHPVLIHGSTGKLYSQLRQGLPADIFLSADTHHVTLLAEQGVIEPDSVKMYAQGELVLVMSKRASENTNTNTDISEYLNFYANKKNSAKITIGLANPNVAPYGMAAKEVLSKLELWPCSLIRCVYGEHVAQTYQYLYTGNVSAVFVARSTLATRPNAGYTFIPIDQRLYAPIFQSAGIVSGSPHLNEAKQFLQFVFSEKGQNLIKSYGYHIKDIN